MAYYTAIQQTNLVQATDPSQVLNAIVGQATGPQINVGDLLTTADPPSTLGGYTQVTTGSGQVGWVPTTAIQAGVMGSTLMNLGIGAAVVLGAWWFMFRKGRR